MNPIIDENFWLNMGVNFWSKKKIKQCRLNINNRRKFKQMFGCTPTVLGECWVLLSKNSEMEDLRPEHLLWACLFLKVYSKESIHATMAGCCEKTFRKYVWAVIIAISDLEPYIVSNTIIIIDS